MATQLVSLVFPLVVGANTPFYALKDGSGNYYETQVLYDPVSGNSASIGASGLAVSGSVSVLSMPSIPAGTNAIGSVSVSSLPSIPSGSNNIGSVSVTSLPALSAGANNIGSVNVANTPSVTVNGTATVSQDGCSYDNITDAVAHTVTAGLLVGFQNLDANAQTVSIAAYDGTSTAGTPLCAPMTLGAGQIITFPRGGIKATSGSVTVECSAAPTTGIQLLYHA